MSHITGWLRRFLNRPGTADLSRYLRLLPAIAAREEDMRGLPSVALRELLTGAPDGACAALREAARRALGERPYDVQLLGALVLRSGLVAEMATGEGKTLVGALAAAGYAADGRSVHVLSVNDYLARRDADWMRPLYELLGVTVGYLGQASTPAERLAAYRADVTYVPVSELGFDVLRDRLRTEADGRVVPEPDVALIDEADCVLIDEARVPMVLAGATEGGDSDREMAAVVREFRAGRHYEVDQGGRNVSLTDAGTRRAEQALGGIDLYASGQLDTLTQLNVALHAHALLERDVDYIVRDGKVELISTSRGRVALLQRWPDGLQAAVEAKEQLPLSTAGQILDSITVESLVRRYPRVCGMTATAVPVGEELREFYDLEIAVIPPNRPCVRVDEPDRLYATLDDKEAAITAEVAAVHATGRPVLIGTLDIAESERLARRLSAAGLSATVLNAKNDAQEAAVVAEAGSRGAITVSTQMAGRGTDIRLGGSRGDHGEVAALGGLQVIGTGRYWSARLDGQLRGRAGRQGDPGGSVFFVSLEDDLITSNVEDVPAPRDVATDGRVGDARTVWTVGHAQRVAEGANLEIHRKTLRYSSLAEIQRGVVLERRERALRPGAALRELADRNPAHYGELTAAADQATLDRVARQIVLYHLDRGWSDHLAALAEIREGIHLRALGHGHNPFITALDPLSEFHAEAVRLFAGLLAGVDERCDETFAAVPVTGIAAGLAAAGVTEPTATWTYLIKENPFGTDIDRARGWLRRRI